MEIAKCRDCGGPIVWFKTRKDKNVPVDLSSLPNPIPQLYTKDSGMVAHFETCTKNTSRRTPPGGSDALPTRPSSGGPRQSAEAEFRAQQSPPRTAAKEALDGKVQGEQTPDDYVPLEDDTF